LRKNWRAKDMFGYTPRALQTISNLEPIAFDRSTCSLVFAPGLTPLPAANRASPAHVGPGTPIVAVPLAAVHRLALKNQTSTGDEPMKLNIRAKLLMGFGVVLALTVAVGIIGYTAASNINNSLDTIYLNRLQSISQIKDVRANLFAMRTAVRQAVLEQTP
jgi:hypothetical protein